MGTGASASKNVTIVGSANMDIVLGVERIPLPGETLLAGTTARYPGGKGLNQAVAAARAGASTTFIGAVGSDDDGAALAGVMTDAGMDTRFLRTEPGGSGNAFIMLDDAGENAIIVASNANATVVELTGDERAHLERGGIVLAQLELPLAVVLETARVAHYGGATVVLNAAPAQALSDELIAELDVLIVNEHEATIVAGIDDLERASLALAARVPRLVVTLGSAGSALYEGGAEVARVAAPRVTVVDTTGAGDTFCGALACALAEGRGFADAAAFASAAAALSVQTAGAVPSIPARTAIDASIA
jgi:ribokinase